MTSMRPELSLGESLGWLSLSLSLSTRNKYTPYLADYTLYKSFLEDIGHSLDHQFDVPLLHNNQYALFIDELRLLYPSRVRLGANAFLKMCIVTTMPTIIIITTTSDNSDKKQ